MEHEVHAEMTRVLYICTVGSGTAGASSNVAEGVMAAIRFKKPALVCLVPSSTGESKAVADIIREGLADEFEFVEDHPVGNHDDLLVCRGEISAAIAELEKKHPDLIVELNPTSGTKQMTAAAIVAAIENELEGVEFISGPREDGVVVTGRETISKMNGRRILADFALRKAWDMLKVGAYSGAALSLKEYQDLFPTSIALARALGYWNRFAYSKAVVECGSQDELKACRQTLMILVESDAISLERGADMLNYVDRSLGWEQAEEALAVLYRLVELFAKHKLKSAFGITDESGLDQIEYYFDISRTLKNQLLRQWEKHGKTIMGLAVCLEVLDCHHELRFTFIDGLYKNKRLWKILQKRQLTRYGHDNQFVPAEEVVELRQAVLKLAIEEWPEFKNLVERFKFPNINDIIDKEALNG